MPISWTTENSEYDTVRVTGLLTWKEFEQLHESIDDPPEPRRKINTLVLLDRFEGWDRAESWGELRYVERNEALLKKVAIVGEQKWRDQKRQCELGDRAHGEFSGADAKKGGV